MRRTLGGAVAIGASLGCLAGAGLVAAGAAGATAPAATPGQLSVRWGVTPAPKPLSFGTLSCDGTGFCAAPVSTSYTATSSDFGLTWTQSRLPNGLAGDPSAPLSCAGGQLCVTEGENGSTGKDDIVVSDDGGRTWADRGALVQFQLEGVTGISCGDVDHCLVVEVDQENPQGADVFTTGDAGKQWVSRGHVGTSDITQNAVVWCRDSADCAMAFVGDTGVAVYATSDEGVHWHALGSEITSMSYPRSITCTSAANCVVVGDNAGATGGAIAETSNGGTTWSTASLPSGTSEIDGVSCASSADCWATGRIPPANKGASATSEILHSSDGGRTWSAALSSPGVLQGIACYTPLTCLAVGPHSVGRLLAAPVVSVAPTPDGKGYYLAQADGKVYAFGDARFRGDMSGKPLRAPIVAIAVDPATGGYWLLGADGGVFSFRAPFYRSTGSGHLRAPVVDLVATPKGDGYRLVASDGGVFGFGPGAKYYGSMGGKHLNAPIVGLADDDATGGYWLVASDGGVFSFHAPFLGSAGSLHLQAPIVQIEALAAGNGYRFVAGDGGVFDYGKATFSGSLGGAKLTSPVSGMAAQPGATGYWLVQANGIVTGFGGVSDYGSA